MTGAPGNYSRPNHTFAIPAYGESPYLRDCLASLSTQTSPSEILITTSTPHADLESLAHEFNVRLEVRNGSPGIGRDWNFALSQVRTQWVTLAHQDDLYLPEFTEASMEAARRVVDASLVFTGYREISGGAVRPPSAMLMVKRALLELGFLGRAAARTVDDRLRTLRFGCPIPCPAVTLNREAAPHARFREDLRVNLDWDMWWRIAKGMGAFAWVRKPLMLHRIHEVSETSVAIRQGVRVTEDREMFKSLWPRPLANLLARAYTLSYERGDGR